MKWFKHLVDSGGDPDILESIELFGANGYYVFFRTLEIMGREFKIKTPGYNDFSMQFFQKNFKISAKKLKKCLQFYKTKKRIFFKIYREKNGRRDQERIKLNCPKLRKLCDEYTDKRLKGKKSKLKNKNRDIRGSKIGSIETDNRSRNRLVIVKPPPAASLSDLDQVILKCESVRELSEKDKKNINVYAWVQIKLNENGHPEAIKYSLDQLIKNWSKPVEHPWAYLNAIFMVKNGNYWEDYHIQESEKFKNIWVGDQDIQEMVGEIGRES